MHLEHFAKRMHARVWYRCNLKVGISSVMTHADLTFIDQRGKALSMLKVGAKKRKRPTRSTEKKTLNLRLDKAPPRRYNDDDDDSFSAMP